MLIVRWTYCIKFVRSFFSKSVLWTSAEEGKMMENVFVIKNAKIWQKIRLNWNQLAKI